VNKRFRPLLWLFAAALIIFIALRIPLPRPAWSASPPPFLADLYAPKTPSQMFRAQALSRQPIEDSAAKIAEAAYKNDAVTLRRYAWPDEVRLNTLTEQKIRILWNEAVLPHLKGAHAVGPAVKKRLSDFAATGEIPLTDKAGHTLLLGSSVDLTKVGHKQVLQDFMFQAWIFDYLTSRGIPFNAFTYPKAYLLGIKAHKALFKRLGINYRVVRQNGLPVHVDTWDEAEKSLWKKVDKLGQTHDLSHIP
jgi:hypothetical protein